MTSSLVANMGRIAGLAAIGVAVAAGKAAAQVPAPTPLPPAVRALEGCWRGEGKAVGKPVVITLTSRAILDHAMLIVDVDSHAAADVGDRYAAHLVFGGLRPPPQGLKSDIVSFWSDTFGGDFAVVGRGDNLAGGFDVTYAYPDDTFVNRWRFERGTLKWVIVERDRSGKEKPFASYAMSRAACPSA